MTVTTVTAGPGRARWPGSASSTCRPRCPVPRRPSSSPTRGPTSSWWRGRTGSPLRADPGWPGLLRGKRSIVLDLHSDDDRTTARRAAAPGRRPGHHHAARRRGPARPHRRAARRAVPAAGGRDDHRLGEPRPVGRLQGLRGPDHGQDRRAALQAAADAGPRPGLRVGAVRLVRGRADRRPRHPRRAVRARVERARAGGRGEPGVRRRRPRHLQLVLRDDPAPLPGRVQAAGRRLRRRRAGRSPG